MARNQAPDDAQAAHTRSAKAQKAEEVQRVGSAKAGAGHPVVEEGGQAESPTAGKGHPLPATSRADAFPRSPFPIARSRF